MKINFLNWLIVKPASWIAGRVGGQAAVAQVQQVVETGIQREIDAAKPRVLAAIDTATVGAEAIVGDAVAFVRGRMVAVVDGLGLSASTQTKVIAVIVTAEAPKVEAGVDAAADKLIEAFAATVKDAIEKL